ncbi:hypothetical protein Daus18300_004958 [Diaporthe australafricana]|uniref:Uncharacterized protein n=1 Tax=Diaporthe australafricana TaxID=127596 RepID=A0ABR3X552_9PEZI
MAVPESRPRAKEVIRQIAKEHGYLGEEKLQALPPETRRDVEETFMRKDEMIGSSVITLTKNLYTSKARFVFELLQNADDNSFSRAAALGESPYISFSVFPDRIVVECNEDGFTDENLKAICAVRKVSLRAINDQFQELKETILLFMKNLKKIRVAFHSIDEAETSSVVYSIERPGSHHAVLTKTVATQAGEQQYVKHYHVTTHQATNFPRHENRTYSSQTTNTSQITLAFPLSDTSVPIIEPQDVFVYLPVRPVGFKFIIQADFVTEASRQDIVKDSPRNSALLDGVADAFAMALLQICELDSDGLRFQWMRYLPDRHDENWGPLWLSLVNKIATRLSQTPVLYCHKKLDRHRIGDLVRLTSDLYADGEPLFEDTSAEKIVSKRYNNRDLGILMQYGLTYACWDDIIRWIAEDLKHGSQSRMQSAMTTANWHTKTAKLLRMLLCSNWEKVFADSKAICIPSDGSNAWASPEACVWNTAQKLDTMFALRTHYQSLSYLDQDNKRDLEQLFTSTLEIADCSLEVYVGELKSLPYSGSEDSGKISTLYKEIDRLSRVEFTQEASRTWLRSQFEDQALIYVSSNEGPSWRKTSQCVWVTAARLRDMVSLNNEYDDLEEFFVDVLGVGPVTLSMAIDELKEVGSRESVSAEEIKASILTVNSLLCSESDSPHPKLLESKIFPVRYPEGGVQYVSAQTQFFIADRKSLRLSFEGQVKFLDFNLEEVVQLHPFFSWIRLEDRIAKHFESPRVTNTSDTDALYILLRNAKILAADTIALELSLSQDGVSHKTLGESINMHLHEKGSNLTVYLPRKKTAQQHAFNKHLPERLLQWLMTEETSQIRHETSDKSIIATKDVWNTPLATLATTLDECGIIQINTPNLDPVVDESSPDPESDMASEGTTGDWGGSRTANMSDNSDTDTLSDIAETPPSATETSYNGITGIYSKGNSGESPTPREALGSPSYLFTRSAAPSSPFGTSQPSVTPSERYFRLLDYIIASEGTGDIPHRNERRMDDLHGSVSGTARRGVPRMDGETQSERDHRVGAAGELFVFELLSRLNPGLPKFTEENWQSTIRHHVCVHPAYASMSSWKKEEVSDITYEDTQGILTDLLIRKNYLDRDKWAGKTPHYFIEVKTTTSACNAPFFMSKAQHKKIGVIKDLV